MKLTRNIAMVALLCLPIAGMAETMGLGNLLVAEQAIQAEKEEKIARIKAEQMASEAQARSDRMAAADQARSDRLKAKAVRDRKAKAHAKAKRKLAKANADRKADEDAEAYLKAEQAESERLEDRELAMMVKRAEAMNKIKHLNVDAGMAEDIQRANLNADVNRDTANIDTIKANNKVILIEAEGDKDLKSKIGTAAIKNAGTPVEHTTIYQRIKLMVSD